MVNEELEQLKAERDAEIAKYAASVHSRYESRIRALSKKQAQATARRRKQNLTHATLAHLRELQSKVESNIHELVRRQWVMGTSYTQVELPSFGTAELCVWIRHKDAKAHMEAYVYAPGSERFFFTTLGELCMPKENCTFGEMQKTFVGLIEQEIARIESAGFGKPSWMPVGGRK